MAEPRNPIADLARRQSELKQLLAEIGQMCPRSPKRSRNQMNLANPTGAGILAPEGLNRTAWGCRRGAQRRGASPRLGPPTFPRPIRAELCGRGIASGRRFRPYRAMEAKSILEWSSTSTTAASPSAILCLKPSPFFSASRMCRSSDCIAERASKPGGRSDSESRSFLFFREAGGQEGVAAMPRVLG